MITWRTGVVVSRGSTWSGAQEIRVRLGGTGADDVAAADLAPADLAPAAQDGAVLPDGTEVRALAYPGLVGDPAVGDRVLLNVSALARGLGTGGYALVVALPDAPPPDPAAGPGHLVKARYTPLQALVLGVDEQESAHHELLRDADDLAGLPVVIADLHSALPAIIAGARHGAALAGRPAPRVAYVMSDGGALPAWFSRTVAGLREAGWIEACLTAGQAFGGDLEAVTVHTALLAARLVVGADLVVVAQGPGNLGTGTRWGFSGVAAGEAVNAAGTLGGRPIASLRVSGADERERHLGISHHSLTAYGRVALAPADVVVPVFPPGPFEGVADADGVPPLEAGSLDALGARINQQALALVAPTGRHRLVRVDAGEDLLAALAASPVRLSTMGRGLAQDPAAFLAAAAAGVHAARLLS
ncbi:DUF3866 family protein [Pengzhenrongella sicca]|uniref:DUF3866 family protein n=1 Tax=Pengzhenrongella sicca TaxID=2819238 RepID=A0A8A4Z8S7_9MICO|nr:DUF3866 family protein [Pengzhenrongella sicca]QTE27831.1 DUF3866 family protein [Pengzhenrongella sicca]